MKSYTSLEQSRKLAEFLPIESADMCFNTCNMSPLMTPYSRFNEFFNMGPTPDFLIPCWSLTTLLDVLPDGTTVIKDEESDTKNEKYMCVAEAKDDIISTFGNNPVDACYEMILKLHELKML